MHVGLRIFASWALQGNISKGISFFYMKLGGQSRCLSTFSPTKSSWWVKPKWLWLLDVHSAGWEASVLMSWLHLFPVPRANRSLKFPVNLIDSNLLLFPRKNSFLILQMENIEQWLPFWQNPGVVSVWKPSSAQLYWWKKELCPLLGYF